MSRVRHYAVRWNGSSIDGGAPRWVTHAIARTGRTLRSMLPNTIIRAGERIYVRVASGERTQTAKPGDWLVRNHDTGEIFVQDPGEMLRLWEYRAGGFYQRERETSPRAGTELELEIGSLLTAGWFSLIAGAYPRLHESLEIISHDRGTSAGHAQYAVPPKWIRSLLLMEESLSKLSSEELQTVCIGEQSEQEELVKRYKLHVAHAFMSEFFENWNQGDSADATIS